MPLQNQTLPMIMQIEELVRDVPGWSPVDQLYTLFNLAYFTSNLEGDILELGSWCGRSASVLGRAAQMTGDSRVVCIDLFPGKHDWKQNPDGSYSFTVNLNGIVHGGYQEQTAWKEPYEKQIAPVYANNDSLLDIFQETIRRRGLSEIVKPYRGLSTIIRNELQPNFKCRLAFIDGDHSYDAVCRDIENIDAVLIPGGWMCFDDAFSNYEGVNRAIKDKLLSNSNYELAQQMTRKFFIARKIVHTTRHSP